MRTLALAALLAIGCAALPPPAPVPGGSKQARVPAAARCAEARECTIVPAGCCASCSMPERRDVRALRADWVEQHGLPGCEETGCPRCHGPANPSLVATCRAGRCAVVDLRHSPITRCSAAEPGDCVLAFAACCECGAPPESVVAVRRGREPTLLEMVCGRGAVRCPQCVGVIPRELSAACVEGRCVVQGRGGGALEGLTP